ncbi:ABC transporter substrate-binding protein [Flavobacterium agricola]|uniref:ABC transporter substrate-binding protein n=1 Tax=Flavobacterium agricola TaxID=2870839 RepID=A0ABY6LZG1_9FLAO|nr:ABC transporter substrate-binding protein [Flavobacterium agricola]UYW01576.1 ABC transporter substrate-binding protein [Flavobacterium agricola]
MKIAMPNIKYVFVVFIAVLATSCSQKNKQNADHLVFRYNESANISSLDPAFAKNQANIWACNQIFNGLVQLTDSLTIAPDLAKNWHISSNGLTYAFTLRNDVYFHKHIGFGPDSTRKVTAYDAAYSLNRLQDDKVASPGGWILQNVANITAKNDSILEINLQKPFPAFLGLLTMKYASIVPQEIVENPNINFRSNPIGTGPFQFKIWEENVKLVLRKNNAYYETNAQGEQLPHLEAIAITFLPDKQAGFLQFIQGKLDFVSGLDPSYKDDILTQTGALQPKYEDKVTMLTGPYLNTEYLGFNLESTENAIADIRIRQALNYGFDRKKMITYLRNGMGTPANSGIIPEGLPGYLPNMGYNYDLEKAKSLVADYKKEKGEQAVKVSLSTNASYVDIAEYLQREWQKIGITCEVDVTPPSTLRQAIATGKVSFFRASWIADYPDAENYLSLFSSTNFAPNGPNYTHYKNKRFDALYQASFLEQDAEKRYKLYQQMDEIMMQDAPVIPLFYDKVVRFTGKNVEGLGMNPLNLLTLKHVKKIPNNYDNL